MRVHMPSVLAGAREELTAGLGSLRLKKLKTNIKVAIPEPLDRRMVLVPLSPRQLKALDILARPGQHTCTSVGSELTGRKSSYGWQTSAREGGRTLHALLRRKLVTFDYVQAPNSRLCFTYWKLSTEQTQDCKESET